jgi:hypothetical protein
MITNVLIPVYGTRTNSLKTSRYKKARTFTDIEEKHLISGEETEAERSRRKANKRKTTSR